MQQAEKASGAARVVAGREDAPAGLARALAALLERTQRDAPARWRSFLDGVLAGARGSVLLSTFRADNGYDFEHIFEHLARSGSGNIQARPGVGLDLATITLQNCTLNYAGLTGSRGVIVHLLAEFGSNVENNFYLAVEGAAGKRAALRFSNNDVTLTNTGDALERDTTDATLYSFEVNRDVVNLYVNGSLAKRKFLGFEVVPAQVVMELIGHDVADLGMSIRGLEIWALDEPFQGFTDNPVEVQLERLQRLLAQGDIDGVHAWIRSYDGVDLTRLSQPIRELLDREIEHAQGFREWIYADILARLPDAQAQAWRDKWSSRIPQPALVVTGLSVRFFRYPNKRLSLGRILRREPAETFDVLNEINFTAYPGDILGVIGSNGAGKSSLLRAISGLVPIRQGEILLRGRHLMLSPGLGIRNELSGRDNIYLACCFMGLSLKQTEALYPEIVSFSELEEFINQPFKYYSDGMKSRLIFSIATSVAPDILMLDELLNAGDIKFQAKAARRMDDLIENTRVVIVVTHSVPFVLEKCSKALLISRGRQVSYGNPKVVVSQYLNELHMRMPAHGSPAGSDAMMNQLQQQSFLPGM